MKVGVLGAGWLGKALVSLLKEDKMQEVRFTNRAKACSDRLSFAYEFGSELPVEFIADLDWLFICSTLPKTQDDALQVVVKTLSKMLPKNCKVVFTSTIGVYQDVNGLVNEESTFLNKDSVYFKMEQWLLNSFVDRCIILRLGGLIGEDRHPITSLAGRENIAGGQKKVNLVHRFDILQFCRCILQNEVEAGIYNLVYPFHPKKSEYYIKNAEARQLSLPTFLFESGEGKIVDSTKSQMVKGFDYKCKI